MKAIVALGILAGLLSGPAPGLSPKGNGGTGARTWQPNLEAARRFARRQPGDVSFAVVGLGSPLRGFLESRTAPAASTIKAMLLASYLRQPSVRRRRLREDERALLGPMIRVSDNAAAAQVAATVGDRVVRLAQAAQMRDFEWEWEPGWIGGQSQISARDQARFFLRYPRYVPKRHQRYTRRLLGSVVSWQRWGIADARPRGWRLYFKGGWGINDDGVGVVNHQAAFLERGRCRIALAILTEHDPSTATGAETQRGVAKRLLRGIGQASCGASDIDHIRVGSRSDARGVLSRSLDLGKERRNSLDLLATGPGAELGEFPRLLTQSHEQPLTGLR